MDNKAYDDHEAAGNRNNNSERKTELDGFRRKATRRVEAVNGRAKISFADNKIGLPPQSPTKTLLKNNVF